MKWIKKTLRTTATKKPLPWCEISAQNSVKLSFNNIGWMSRMTILQVNSDDGGDNEDDDVFVLFQSIL